MTREERTIAYWACMIGGWMLLIVGHGEVALIGMALILVASLVDFRLAIEDDDDDDDGDDGWDDYCPPDCALSGRDGCDGSCLEPSPALPSSDHVRLTKP